MTIAPSLSAPPVAANVETALHSLRAHLRRLECVVVGFSGGVDSSLLAWVASDVLGHDALVVTAVSPSLAPREHSDCELLAAEWALQWIEVETNEMANAAYRINDSNRCFHCKDALMDEVGPIAADHGAVVLLGVNVDDLGDHRPGQQAAEARGAIFPLVEAGFDKSLVRQASRRLGLRTADKPAAACLASRLPYGTPVTLGVLRSVDRAEDSLHRLGFNSLRIRHYDDVARLEVPIDRLAEVVDRRQEVIAAVKAAGYRYVTLDLEGLRSGNLNQVLKD